MTDVEDELPARRGSRMILLAIPLALAGAAGFFIYSQRSARSQLETTPGHPDGAVVVAGEHGAFLVVIDRVSRSGSHRFAAIDLATGSLVGQRVVDESARCWPASAGRMWCGDDDGHIHLIAVPGFEAAQASDADRASRTWLGKAEAGCALEDTIALGSDRLTFGDGSPRALVIAGQPPADSAPVFFSPAFLRTDRPELVLVQHDAALDRPVVQVSRIDGDRHVMWTADVGGRCETASTSSGKLVITTRDAPRRAAAFDLATGAVAWRFAFREAEP